jgi:uncharacterized membrane protein (TIGR02234 family)
VPTSRRLAVLLALAGGLLAVVAGGRTWLSLTASGDAVGIARVAVTGRQAAPGGVALGLVAAAAAVVLATSGRVLRQVVGGLLVACGLGLVAVTVVAGAAQDDLVRDAMARATGTTSAPATADGSAQRSVWPDVSAAGGVLALAGGTVALLRSRRWGAATRRYEISGQSAPRPPSSAVRDRSLDAWDSLDAGADPTVDRAGDPVVDRAVDPVAGPVPPAAAAGWHNGDDPGGDP